MYLYIDIVTQQGRRDTPETRPPFVPFAALYSTPAPAAALCLSLRLNVLVCNHSVVYQYSDARRIMQFHDTHCAGRVLLSLCLVLSPSAAAATRQEATNIK